MTDSKKEELLKACNRLINEVEVIADDDLDQFSTDVAHIAAFAKSLLTEREGWVLVPKEPTEEMLIAVTEEWERLHGLETYRGIYRDFIAAAPKQEKSE